MGARNERFPLAQRPATVGPPLIVCRTLEHWRTAVHTIGGEARAVVVASDDPRVLAVAAEHVKVKSTTYIEKIEAFYAVAADVIRLIEAVNAWLGRVADDTAVGSLILWPVHCEGGETSQRVQDLLLLARSYESLLAKYAPQVLYVVTDHSSKWNDALLVGCASDVGVPTQLIPHGRFIRRLRSWTADLRPYAKELYWTARTLAFKCRRAPPIPAAPEKLVAIQLCDGAVKHRAHTTPLMRALEKRMLQPVAVCWAAGTAARNLRAEGLYAIEGESLVTCSDLIRSWRIAWHLHRSALRKRDDFLPETSASGGMIRSILWAVVLRFLVAEVPQRLRLYSAMKTFWLRCQPVAARLWTRVLPQAVIAYRALPNHYRPVLFWQPGWPYQVQSPYENYPVPADLIFAISAEHATILKQKCGTNSARVVVAGLPWLRRINEFRKDNSREDSRRKLAIGGRPKLCVLCDPGYFIRGYMAAAEQAMMLTTLLNLARRSPEMHLIIKPHPSHSRGALEAILSTYRLHNITLVPHTNSPLHALNAADLLVTKFSTLAVEAMALGVPAISAILDGEREFACFDDAVEYVWQPDELTRTVERFIDDTSAFTEWKENLSIKAAQYLYNNAGDALDANDVIAEELRETLCSKR